jgi:hypothetical protein
MPWRQLTQDCHGKSRIQQEDSFHRQITIKFKEETIKLLHLEQSFVGAVTWTLRTVGQEYLESSEMW